MAAALAAAGLPLAVVNPAQIRAFARAIGRLGKTEPLDAALIARFAEQSATPRPVAEPQARMLAESSPDDASSSRGSAWRATFGARRER